MPLPSLIARGPRLLLRHWYSVPLGTPSQSDTSSMVRRGSYVRPSVDGAADRPGAPVGIECDAEWACTGLSEADLSRASTTARACLCAAVGRAMVVQSLIPRHCGSGYVSVCAGFSACSPCVVTFIRVRL